MFAVRHAKKYMGLYSAQAGFEIVSTDRYAKVTQKVEAAVVANRAWQKSELITFCSGKVIALSEEQVAYLKNMGERDFSVVYSSRWKAPALFLGPARFVNHDCNPNCNVGRPAKTSLLFVVYVAWRRLGVL